MIEEYICSLGLPTGNYISNKISSNSIMAISSKVTEMLSAFWENNKDLLLAVVSTIAQDDLQDDEVREKAKEFFNAVSIRREKDKTHYRFNGEAANGKFALVRLIILSAIRNGASLNAISGGFTKVMNSLCGGRSKKEVFDEIRTFLISQNIYTTCPAEDELYDPKNVLKMTPLVYSIKDYSEWWGKQGKTKEIYTKFEDGDVYIMNQWGYASIDYFIYAFYKKRKEWKLNDCDIEV